MRLPLLLLTLSALAPLAADPPAVGVAAPPFTAADESGNTVRLAELRGAPVLLAFYPKDFTPG